MISAKSFPLCKLYFYNTLPFHRNLLLTYSFIYYFQKINFYNYFIILYYHFCIFFTINSLFSSVQRLPL